MEFWSTVVAFDPFPSTVEPEKCPLREFLIKFSVLNGQRPLTLDFKIFCSTTGLDYNNGKYVAHPTPKVLGGNYSSTKQVNSIQQLLAFSLITGTEVAIGEIIYSDLTFADIQAYLLSEDELDKENDEEEVLAAGDDMDEDIQADEEARTPSPKQDQPEPSQVQESASDSSSLDLTKFDNILPLTKRQLIKYLRKVSRVLFSRITGKQWEHHEEVAASYADLKASIDQYYDENIAHRDQTDKLVEASMSSLDRSITTISDLYKGLDVIAQLFKDINNAIKNDPVANQKINEATETFT
ncbi:hypothetical protein Tco_0568270 [Tanacetum coccineum]